MKRAFQDRRVVLVLGALSLLAMLLLAVGLDNLGFQDGIPFNPDQGNGSGGTGSSFSLIVKILQQAACVIVVLSVIASVVILINKETRYEFLRRLLMILIFAGLFLFGSLFFQNGAEEPEPTQDPVAFPTTVSLPDFDAPYAEFPESPTAPETSSWAGYIFSLMVILMIAGLVWFIWSQRKKPPLQELAQIALTTAAEIEAGQDFEDAIIRCYAQMIDVVKKRRGIKRDDAMTPKEFASILENYGLPGTPIRTLTRLFEGVRYGGMQSSVADAFEASDCLRAISAACGNAGL